MKKPKDPVKPMNLENEPWERELWEQLDGEPDRAYGAFQIYLSLGMGRRTYVAAAAKLGKQRNYEAALRQWASKFQWRARCQAFDAAQLEKEREDAEQARLEIFATGFTLGHYFFEHVGEDLKRQWRGTQINPETGEEEPYKKPNSFSINQKLKMLNWAYDMAVKNAVEKKSGFLKSEQKLSKITPLMKPSARSWMKIRISTTLTANSSEVHSEGLTVSIEKIRKSRTKQGCLEIAKT